MMASRYKNTFTGGLAALVIACGAGGGESIEPDDGTGTKDEAESDDANGTDSHSGSDGDADSDADADIDSDTDLNVPTDDGDTADTQTTADTAVAPDTLSPDICLENTRDERECLDCCGCLDAACEDKVLCRERCEGHLYQNNDDYVDLAMPSELGQNGDYLSCTIRGETPACQACCLCSETLLCGDIPYCEAACLELSK